MSLSKVSLSLFALFITLWGAAVSYSAEHGHKTPHGGVVKEAEGMHLEFVIDKSGDPKLYLYDRSMRPLERIDLQA